VMDEKARSPHEAYYFYWGQQLQAIRSGQWKLHFPHDYRTLKGKKGGMGGKPAPYANAHIELSLFDLSSDLGEKTNVAGKHPDVVKRLQALADLARKDLGDKATEQTGSGVRQPGRLDE
jgi:arylsulfatase A